jgi:fatty acid desaturase
MQTYVEPRFTDQQGRSLWRAMFAEVNGQRLMRPATTRVLVKLSLLSGLMAGVLALSWSQHSLWLLGLSWLACSLLLMQFSFIGHDAGHGAISANAAVNRVFGQISMTLVTGLAFDEWIARHHAHHRFCQDETRDPDMAVALVVSLTEKSGQEKGVFGKLMTRYQAIHIWLLSLFFGHSQRHLSQAAVLANPRSYPLDSLMLVLHFALWFAVPCLLFDVPFLAALLAYIIPLTIAGPHLAAIFWVNHIGMPLIEDPEQFSFFEHQTVTSRTIINAPRYNWLFGGLNFQIEHHLFPQVPSHRLSEVQRIVQQHFSSNRIEYQGVSWWNAIKSIAGHLREVAHKA